MRHDDPAARLLVALDRSDDVALASVLNRDASLLIDSGDETGGESRGRARVARALREWLTRHPDASLEAADVNGAPALTLRRTCGEVIGVLAIEVGGAASAGSITRLWLTIAPRKLAHWNRRRPDDG